MKAMWSYRLLEVSPESTLDEARARHAVVVSCLPKGDALRARYDDALRWMEEHWFDGAVGVEETPSSGCLPALVPASPSGWPAPTGGVVTVCVPTSLDRPPALVSPVSAVPALRGGGPQERYDTTLVALNRVYVPTTLARL